MIPRRLSLRLALSLAWGMLFFLGAAVSFLPGPLASCEILGRWPGGRVRFQVNPNFPDHALSGTPEEQAEIIGCAAKAWEEQSRASIEFVLEGTSSRAGVDLSDTVNNISWIDADGGEAFAATFIKFDGESFLGFDMVFFSTTGGIPNRWRGPGEPAPGEVDIWGVAAHELGHVAGLGHSNDSDATMYPPSRDLQLPLRTLHPDDKACIEELYGLRSGYVPAVEILAVLPDSGPMEGGNEVVLEGKNFTYDSDTQLAVAGSPVSSSEWRVDSCGKIRIFEMPPHLPGPVTITVTNSIGTGTLESAYTYLPPPSILSVMPGQGPLCGGIPITVRGQDFREGAVAYLGDRPLLGQKLVGTTSITGNLPASEGPGLVDVRVEQGIQKAVLPGSFYYNPHFLEVADVSAYRGQDPVHVPVMVTSANPLSAISFGLSYAPGSLSIQELSTAGTPVEAAESVQVRIDNAAGVASVAILMDSLESEPCFPVGSKVRLGTIVAAVSTKATIGSRIPVRIVSGVGNPPAQLFFVVSGTVRRTQPLTDDGSVSVVPKPFVRGDADLDGSVNISDAIYLLIYLFAGGALSNCPDAADFNDDGLLNLSDSVFLLLFLFVDGKPVPPPWDAPGIDPTPDALACGA